MRRKRNEKLKDRNNEKDIIFYKEQHEPAALDRGILFNDSVCSAACIVPGYLRQNQGVFAGRSYLSGAF
jgi:hypothetical protein